MRVPAIFWWPGQIEASVISDIGSTMDVYATALALAGAEPTPDIDGLDMSRTLLEGMSSPRETMAFYRAGELRAFRKGNYKLHFITEGAYGQGPPRTVHAQPLLFNLRDDVSEKFDVAAEHPDVVADILATVEAHRALFVQKPPLFDERIGR